MFDPQNPEKSSLNIFYLQILTKFSENGSNREASFKTGSWSPPIGVTPIGLTDYNRNILYYIAEIISKFFILNTKMQKI